MKKFLIKLLLYIILLFLLVVCDILIRSIYLNNASLNLDKNINTLFVGSSHFACNIDDSLLLTAKNISTAGERYLYTYIKLKKIIKDNPQIKTVFCSCAPLDIFPSADYYYYDEHIEYFVPRYFPLFSIHEYSVFKKHKVKLLSGFFCEYHHMHHFSPQKYLENLGGYTKLEGQAKKFNPQKEIGYGGNEVQLKYLKEIIDLCKQKQIRLILMLTPNKLLETVYDLDYYYSKISSLGYIEYLDLHNWRTDRTNIFYDAGHLNDQGAKDFTIYISKKFNLK